MLITVIFTTSVSLMMERALSLLITVIFTTRVSPMMERVPQFVDKCRLYYSGFAYDGEGP